MRDVEAREAFAHVIEELVIADRCAGYVDRIGAGHCSRIAGGAAFCQHAERGANDPAIDRGHQVIALGGRNESDRRNQLVPLVDQANEQLVVQDLGARSMHRMHRLRIQAEPVLRERAMQPVYPFHFAAAQRDFAVFGPIDLHAIAPLVLREVARGIGGGQHGRERVRPFGEITRPMLTPIVNDAVLPGEPKIDDRLAQRFGDAQRGRRRAMRQQHAELVSAEARQHVAFAQPRPQQGADLAQQFVTGGVPAGVVDDLELIEVEIQHRMLSFLRFPMLDDRAYPLLEFAPVQEARQRIVAREIRKPRRILALAAHVLDDEHGADRPAARSRIGATL